MITLNDYLEHNDFLTSQSQRIREFYKYMANEYPYLAFTFKGRLILPYEHLSRFQNDLID